MKKLKSIALSNIGEAYNLNGNYLKALDYQMKALKLKEEIGDKKGVAAVNDAIGLVYASYRPDDFKTPAEYHNKALKINKELKNEYGISTSYLYLGRLYYGKFSLQKEQSAADTAVMYLNKCRDISEKIGNIRYLTTIDDILGQIYLTSEKYDSAYSYFSESLKMKEQTGNIYGIISSYIYFSTLRHSLDRIHENIE